MNYKNLKPIKLTHEQAVEYGRRGGIASGKSKQHKKELLKQMQFLELTNSKDTRDLLNGLTKRELFYRYLKRYEPQVYDAMMQVKMDLENITE